MRKILITILAVLGMACSAFGQGVLESKNITYTGTNTFLGMLIGNGTNLTGIVKTNEMGSGATWTGSNWVFAGSSSTTSLVVNIRGNLLYDAEGSNIHFEVDASYLKDFSTLIGTARTTNSVTGWSYYNGTAFVDLTTNGLLAAYQTPALGMVMYNGFTVSQHSNVYVRVRSWDGTDYSLYEVSYGKGFVNLATFSGGIYSGSSYTNLAGLGASYLSSSTGVVVDALAYNKYIMNLSTNLVMQAPTNAIAGRSLQWSITASGGDRTVTWPTNIFKIPSSSTMSNVVTIVSNTESIFVIEYRTNAPQWKLETYVWGY